MYFLYAFLIILVKKNTLLTFLNETYHTYMWVVWNFLQTMKFLSRLIDHPSLWATLRKASWAFYPCINISQTFHKPYINNRRRQNCVFFLHRRHSISHRVWAPAAKMVAAKKTVPLDLYLYRKIYYFCFDWLKGINQILNTIRAEEDPREHKQQARPCHEERQVHSRFQDRPPISPQLKRFFFYCVKCCWFVFCSFDFVVFFFFKLFLDSILNIGDWFLLVGEMQGSW